VRCFACQWTGDAMHLVALVKGLDMRSEFRAVLAACAEVAGHIGLRDEILGGDKLQDRPQPAVLHVLPSTEYPDCDEVHALWNSLDTVSADADAWELLRGRAIDPDEVDRLGLAKTLSEAHRAPWWASHERVAWADSGHRLLLPVWDANGSMRSVRAWGLFEGPLKRLPPAGKRSGELVLANRHAVAMFRGEYSPLWLWIVEGEPDFLTGCLEWEHDAVVGVGSGWWSQSHAARVPDPCRVVVATHADEAGDAYAYGNVGPDGRKGVGIIDTLADRCRVYRWRPEVAA
jgi:hypothetical protein